jgi:magnesium and cobalt transporter
LRDVLEKDRYGLGPEERRLMLNSLEIHERVVREIMVPRIDMITVQAADGVDGLIKAVRSFGHSRIPLVADDAESVIGILLAKDFLGMDQKERRETRLQDRCKPAFFVPETKNTFDLLRDFQMMRTHLAIVSDEYGGVSGLVSMEDLLEVIVGDIQDEYDREEEQVIKVRKNMFNIDARLAVESLNGICRADLPLDLAETVGGLFLEVHGAAPEKNAVVTCNGHRLRVLAVDGNRINRLQLTLPAVPAPRRPGQDDGGSGRGT